MDRIKLCSLDLAQCFNRWSWIRAGLLAIIEKTKTRMLPEDVYLRLNSNTAWLYVIGEDIGFVVLTQEHDPDGLVMFIWALWIEPGKGREIEMQLYEQLEALACSIKAVRIRMQSPRQGWERRPFFEPVATVFEHEVKL